MIFITADCHGDFRRFTKKERRKLPYEIGKEDIGQDDYVIICGDFGLLWRKDKTFEYNLNWLSQLPFTILWVQGNHENYNMIAEYPIEMWCGGKVRHILRDKIILLERGQVFEIQGKTIFTFGGASSHDIQGGVLDKSDPAYDIMRREAIIKGLSYRVLNESWWSQELPTKEEMQEGRDNLEKVGWKVDYVVTHCASTSIQAMIGCKRGNIYEKDILTDYFEELEQKLQYKMWYFGHYHLNAFIDEKHTVLYHPIVILGGMYEHE